MSWPLPRFDQIAAEPAVDSGAQDRNACGETPSRLALWPLSVTFPPSTGSTAWTPRSLEIAASCEEVMPLGTAAMRSGTLSCRWETPPEPEAASDCAAGLPGAATPGGGVLVKSKEPPGGAVLALAVPAKPASVAHAAAATTDTCTARRRQAARAAHRGVWSGTMYKTI